ncbi:MAG: DUF502 domain-containing protein [Myxococcota bacterium]
MDPAEFERDVGRFKHHLRRTLMAGVLLLIPTVVTIWVLYVVFSTVDALLGNLLASALGVRIPGLGLLLTLLLIYGVGLFASNVAGKKFIDWFEGLMQRVPMVRAIYRVSKELSLAFGKKEKRPFRKVVALEFPRKGMWVLGFITGDVGERSPAPEGSVYVFIPTTPNPTSGWLVLIPEEDLIPTSYTVDEGTRIIISAGIVGPDLKVGEILEGANGATVVETPKDGGRAER